MDIGLEKNSIENTENRRKAVLLTIIPLFIFVLLLTELDIANQLQQWTQGETNIIAILILATLFMILCALTPLPAEAATIANTLVFGPAIGILVSWLSAMLGAYIAYLYGMKMRNSISPTYFETAKWRLFETWFQKWGTMGFLLARSIPLVPFFVINIGSAFLPIQKSTYLWITGLAILPHIALLSYLSGCLLI